MCFKNCNICKKRFELTTNQKLALCGLFAVFYIVGSVHSIWLGLAGYAGMFCCLFLLPEEGDSEPFNEYHW